MAEHSALRRVAELVARGADPEALFRTVTAEASRLLGGRATALLRAGGDGGFTVVAVCGDGPAVGSRVAAAPESEGAPITVAGRLWGVLACGAGDRPLTAGSEARLHEFADLVAAALSTAEARAQLAASRTRVLASADEARRRMQRDLHDGAQQRLVQTVISLKLAKRALERGDDRLPALIDESLHHAELATNDLRDLAYGILPASLSRGGLRAGVETLVSGLPLPVTVDVTPRRLPGGVETTSYFVVAEALTNVVKHARATQAWVTAQDVAGVLWITVRDDGAGGATAGRGSGLTGLADRVEAAEGTLAMASPPGEGTALTVALPLPPGEETNG